MIYRRPNLYPKQKAAIFSPDRYGIIEGSTKCGKTVACIAWILEQAMGGLRGQAYWWISPVYPQAKVAYRRLKRGLLLGRRVESRLLTFRHQFRAWRNSARAAGESRNIPVR